MTSPVRRGGSVPSQNGFLIGTMSKFLHELVRRSQGVAKQVNMLDWIVKARMGKDYFYLKVYCRNRFWRAGKTIAAVQRPCRAFYADNRNLSVRNF